MGARVGDRAIAAMKQRDDMTVIHIDIDPAEIGKNLDVDIPIVGDLTLVLGQLLEAVKGGADNSGWKKQLDGFREDKAIEPAPAGYVNPKEFIHALDRQLPDDAVVVAGRRSEPDLDGAQHHHQRRQVPDLRRHGHDGLLAAGGYRRKAR